MQEFDSAMLDIVQSLTILIASNSVTLIYFRGYNANTTQLEFLQFQL